MNRLLAIFSFLLCIASNAQGQNLVPNGSFEEIDTCPNAVSQLNRASHWFNVSDATPDFFNSCETIVPYSVSVPSNVLGYQNAHTGNGYAGVVFAAGDTLVNGTNFQWVEYLGVKLKEPMKQTLYKVSFYVSLADSANSLASGKKIAGCGLNIFNCLFSNSNFPYMTGTDVYNVSPNFEVKLSSPVLDSLGWTKIQGYYYAEGDEQYLLVGQLNNTYSEYSTNKYDPSLIHLYNAIITYYYYDDIEVMPISEDEFPNIFTPNGDGINDVFDLKINCNDCALQLQIFNRWGQQIEVNNTFKWDGTHKSNTCADGVYYYLLYDTQNQQAVHSGFVQLQNH